MRNAAICIISVLLSLVIVSASAASMDAAAQNYERGIGEAAEGDLSAARDYFNKSVEENPGFVPGIQALSLLDDIASGDVEREAGSHIFKAIDFANKSNYDRAIKEFTVCIKRAPDYPVCFLNRGLTFSYMGESESALEDINRAIEINPEYRQAYVARGIVLTQIGNRREALDDYNTAINLNPEDFTVFFNRALLKVSFGDDKGAIEDYTRAIELEPGFASSYHGRAGAYLRTGMPDKALADINKAIEIEPAYAVYYLARAQILDNADRRKDALAAYEEFLANSDKSTKAYEPAVKERIGQLRQ